MEISTIIFIFCNSMQGCNRKIISPFLISIYFIKFVFIANKYP